jgi:hypothetical protein
MKIFVAVLMIFLNLSVCEKINAQNPSGCPCRNVFGRVQCEDQYGELNLGCGYFFTQSSGSSTGSGSPCAPADVTGKKAVCNSEISNLPVNWNDKIQSFYLASDTECIMTKDSNFGGEFFLALPCTSIELPAYNYSYSNNDPCLNTGPYPYVYSGNLKTITSIKCARSGYFTKNNMAAGTGRAYEHSHFAGNFITLTASTKINDLGTPWNNKISSIKLGSGMRCMFYKDKDLQGTALIVEPTQAFYEVYTRGYNDAIKSVYCYPWPPPGGGQYRYK